MTGEMSGREKETILEQGRSRKVNLSGEGLS